MIIDCREPSHDHERQQRVFVDGVEIHQVWYLDDVLGYVRTFEVNNDGKVHTVSEGNFAYPEVSDRGDGVLSRTIYGTVELRPL